MFHRELWSSYPIGALGAHIVSELVVLVVYRIYRVYQSSQSSYSFVSFRSSCCWSFKLKSINKHSMRKSIGELGSSYSVEELMELTFFCCRAHGAHILLLYSSWSSHLSESSQSSCRIGALGAHVLSELSKLIFYRSSRSSYRIGALGAHITSELT